MAIRNCPFDLGCPNERQRRSASQLTTSRNRDGPLRTERGEQLEVLRFDKWNLARPPCERWRQPRRNEDQDLRGAARACSDGRGNQGRARVTCNAFCLAQEASSTNGCATQSVRLIGTNREGSAHGAPRFVAEVGRRSDDSLPYGQTCLAKPANRSHVPPPRTVPAIDGTLARSNPSRGVRQMVEAPQD
jgi:hypothetical protein